jgi:VIT1/CCC1 family predicted Fe2+/Mn2+ transporter
VPTPIPCADLVDVEVGESAHVLQTFADADALTPGQSRHRRGGHLRNGSRAIPVGWPAEPASGRRDGLATLVGSALPAIPFIFGVSNACILASIAITLAAAGVIGHYRGYLVTYSILAVVSVVTVSLSVLVA